MRPAGSPTSWTGPAGPDEPETVTPGRLAPGEPAWVWAALAVTFSAGAIAARPALSPGLPHRTSAALAALFTGLAVLRSPVGERLPLPVRVTAEVMAIGALLTVVSTWR